MHCLTGVKLIIVREKHHNVAKIIHFFALCYLQCVKQFSCHGTVHWIYSRWVHPCTLDPGSPCRDDEAVVVFLHCHERSMRSQNPNLKPQTSKLKTQNSKLKLYPPNLVVVIPAWIAGIQLPWMANRNATKNLKPNPTISHANQDWLFTHYDSHRAIFLCLS